MPRHMVIDILCPGPSLAAWPPAYFTRRRRRHGSTYRSIAVNKAAIHVACDYWAFLDQVAFEQWREAAAARCRRHRPRRALPIPFTRDAFNHSLLALHGDRWARWGVLTCEAAVSTLEASGAGASGCGGPPQRWDNFTKGGALVLARVLAGPIPARVEIFGDDMTSANDGADFTGEPGAARDAARWADEHRDAAAVIDWLAQWNIAVTRRSPDSPGS